MIYLKEENGYTGVFLKGNCGKGTVVVDLASGKLVREPTRTSIQVGDGFHIEDEVGCFINHSCQPSCKIETFSVVTLGDLSEGEEITFDYSDNEDTIASPFECKCCGKIILGGDSEQKTT